MHCMEKIVKHNADNIVQEQVASVKVFSINQGEAYQAQRAKVRYISPPWI